MLYLLTILFPIAIAASCFILRTYTRLSIAIAGGAVLTLAFLVAQIPIDDPARFLGVTLILSQLGRVFLFLFLAVVAIALFASWHLPHGENFVSVALLMLALICAVLLLQDPFLVSLLLIGAGLAAVLAIVDLPTGSGVLLGTRVIATALKYLVLTMIAGMLMYLGFVLADVYELGQLPGRIPLTRFVLALIAAGFALRLAVIPFHSWLPDLVEDAAPLVSALIVAVVNTTSLLVLILSFQRFPILISENAFGLQVIQIIGLITALLGALLALVQPNLRRGLAYLLIYDAGIVLFGVCSINQLGLAGALFHTISQIAVVMLLFVALAQLEQPDGRTPGVVRRDLLRRWPIAGICFLAGGFALLGVPPFSSFVGKYLIYQAAAQQGPWFLGLLVGSSLIAALALLRLAREWLLGPAEELPVEEPLMLGETDLDRPAVRRLAPEPRSTAFLTMGLVTLCLILGLYPVPLLDLISDVVRSLTFIRAL
jgi:formate hydrogenlyase subunit 3/multisubunit Na+/H+ antiporter MnhD subunit